MTDLGHTISVLGLGLAAALLLGSLVHYARLPKVTAYVVLGILLGPFGAGVITSHDIDAFKIVTDFALGLIVFSIGGEFKIGRFRKMGRRIFIVCFFEIVLTLIFVSCLVFTVKQDTVFAILLGIISIATAPAATLLVLREFDSEGPVTNIILILVGINNLACLALFRLIFPFVQMVDDPAIKLSLTNVLFWPLASLIGSLVTGILLGLAVVFGEGKLRGKGEVLTLLFAAIAAGIAVGAFFGMSPLLVNLSLGCTVTNLSRDFKSLMNQLKSIDMPFYIMFFVIAGASLHLDLLPAVGVIGLAYVIGRTLGKVAGVYLGAGRIRAPKTVRMYGGAGILAQAGIAIGLCMIVEQHFKHIGPTITSTVLSSVVLFEIAGPIVLRWVLIKSGEVKLINFLYRPQPFQFGEFIVTRMKQLLGLFSHIEGHKEGPILVKHLMRSQVETIAEDTPFDQILKVIEHSKYNQFPVIDREEMFTGLIAFQEIRDSLYDEAIRNLIIAKDLAVSPKVTVTPEMTLEEALDQFTRYNVDFIPVVAAEEPGRLVGILKQGDVLAVFRERK